MGTYGATASISIAISTGSHFEHAPTIGCHVKIDLSADSPSRSAYVGRIVWLYSCHTLACGSTEGLNLPRLCLRQLQELYCLYCTSILMTDRQL